MLSIIKQNTYINIHIKILINYLNKFNTPIFVKYINSRCLILVYVTYIIVK